MARKDLLGLHLIGRRPFPWDGKDKHVIHADKIYVRCYSIINSINKVKCFSEKNKGEGREVSKDVFQIKKSMSQHPCVTCKYVVNFDRLIILFYLKLLKLGTQEVLTYAGKDC